MSNTQVHICGCDTDYKKTQLCKFDATHVYQARLWEGQTFFSFTAIASKIGEEDEGVGVTVVTKTPFDDIFYL